MISNASADAAEVPQKQIGIVLSYTIVHADLPSSALNAQVYLTRFHEAVAELAKTGFPELTHTMASRQEYLP